MFDRIRSIYEYLDLRWKILRWAITGPALIAIGVTQAIYGWVGNSVWMRFGYSAICILFGLFIMAAMYWIWLEHRNED